MCGRLWPPTGHMQAAGEPLGRPRSAQRSRLSKGAQISTAQQAQHSAPSMCVMRERSWL